MSVYPFWRKLLAPVGKWLFRLQIEGTENIPKQGSFILCSNHRSVLDPFFMAVAVPRTIRFMAKSELFADHGRFARWLLYPLAHFPSEGTRGMRSRCGRRFTFCRTAVWLGFFRRAAVCSIIPLFSRRRARCWWQRRRKPRFCRPVFFQGAYPPFQTRCGTVWRSPFDTGARPCGRFASTCTRGGGAIGRKN